MKAFVAFLAFVWFVSNPWLLALLGAVFFVALSICVWRFVQDTLAVEPSNGPWSHVEPRFEWAKEQGVPNRSQAHDHPRHDHRTHDNTAWTAAGNENTSKDSAEEAIAARIAELLDKTKEQDEQLVQLRNRIKSLEAEAADVPARIREAVNSGREQVLRAFGYDRDSFEAMLREYRLKERAHAEREQSRHEERQREERQRQEAGRKRREQSQQRRSRSSKPWWEVLGVGADASEGDVRQAYQSLARRFHPDRKGTGDTARMAEINAARDEFRQRRAKAA